MEQPDGTTRWELTGELKPAHYRGWSLTLPEGEKLTDEQWGQVAEAFMTRMEFHGRGSDAPCRWVAVHHGGSGSQGLDHIHIAGEHRRRGRHACGATTGSVSGPMQACDEIAQELVFERTDGSTFQLSRVDGHQHKRGQKGFVRGELESDYDARDRRRGAGR